MNATQRDTALQLLADYGHQPQRLGVEWRSALLPTAGTKPGKSLCSQVYAAWHAGDTVRLSALLDIASTLTT